MRRALVIVVILFFSLVALSLYHQARRQETIGQRLADELRQASLGETLTPSPPVTEYAPGGRDGYFEAQFSGGSVWVEQSATRVELRGEFSEATSVTDPGLMPQDAKGLLLVLPQQRRKVSAQVQRVILGGRLAGGDIEADGYRLSFSRTEGAVRKLLEPSAPVDIALARVIGNRWGDPHRARRMLAEQRQSLLQMSECELFEAMLAADIAVLARDDDPPSAVRRALLLTARLSTNIVVTWNGGRGYALADPTRTAGGESVVRGFGFSSDGKLAWHATMFVRDAVSPERTRRVIESIGGG